MSSAVARPPRHSRPRAARGEPVPRPLAAGRLAARVRRAGDRPGAGRRLPHGRRRRAGRRIRCTPISCLAAIPRCRSSTRSTASATARASPPGAWSRSSTAQAIFTMAVSFHHDEPGMSHQATMPDVPEPEESAERSRDQGAGAAADARPGTALLRARAADRVAAGRARPLPRQEDRRRPLSCLDPRHRPAARRAGHPPMRARLRLRHDAARLRR